MIDVRISVSYPSHREAKAVAGALSPNNISEASKRGTRVVTVRAGKFVKARVVSYRDLSSVLLTVEDLLACMQAANHTIKRTVSSKETMESKA